MADKPIREQSALELLETHAKALEAENERLREALAMLYDKWEDGTLCYQNPEDYTGHLGNAIKLSYEEEEQILALIPRERSAVETSRCLSEPEK